MKSVFDQYDSVYQIPISSIDGETNILSKLDGKVSLFTNIATKAGYTPKCSNIWSFARTAKRLWELEQLHNMFDNFSVVGFPCNQFYSMEPSADSGEIYSFIKKAYPFITFPISEPVNVNGENEHPVFTFLKGRETRKFDDSSADDGEFAKANMNKANEAILRVPNNYESFIIGTDGKLLYRFGFRSWPLDDQSFSNESDMTIRSAISSLLA